MDDSDVLRNLVTYSVSPESPPVFLEGDTMFCLDKGKFQCSLTIVGEIEKHCHLGTELHSYKAIKGLALVW